MRYPSLSSLSGTIPSELGGITELVSGGDAWNSCFLVANELTSSLPTQLGNLVKMETRFRAHENALSSTVPTELGNMISMVSDFNFRDNSLSSELPTELGKLENMAFSFYFRNNLLSSTIPTVKECTYINISPSPPYARSHVYIPLFPVRL